MTAERLCLTTCSVGYIRSKELGSRRPKAPLVRIQRMPDEAEGLGSCCFASRNKNRVPQTEGDMTLRVWLGSKLECSDSDRRNTDCAQAGSERTDRSIHSRMVKLMAPAPPG